MDTHSVQLLSTVNLDKSHSKGKLRRLATSHCRECQQTLSRNGRDTDGSFQPNTSKCPIHKAKTRPPAWSHHKGTCKASREERTRRVHLGNWYLDDGKTVYSDQTGQFPTQLRRGNQYIMVMVEINWNYTLVEPLKNRTDKVMTVTYQALMKRLQRADVTTTKHVLDNEC